MRGYYITTVDNNTFLELEVVGIPRYIGLNTDIAVEPGSRRHENKHMYLALHDGTSLEIESLYSLSDIGVEQAIRYGTRYGARLVYQKAPIKSQ